MARCTTRANLIAFFLSGFLCLCIGSREASFASESEELASKLESSGVLEKGYKCSVKLDAASATVSTYLNSASKNQDNDCKILAVLIAKKLFELRENLSRVKVKLLDSKNTGQARNVSVSLGDIQAFSSGKTSMEQLLTSLEISRSQETPAPDPNDKNKSASAKGEPGEKSEAGLRKILPSGRKTPIVFYLERKTGVRLAYPHNFNPLNAPDKDTLVQFNSGDTAQSIDFSIEQDPSKLSVQQYAKILAEIFSKNLKEFQILESYPVLFGSKSEIRGYAQEYRFRNNSQFFRILMIYFALKNNQHCTLKFSCPESDISEFRLLEADILSQVDISKSGAVAGEAAATGKASSRDQAAESGSRGGQKPALLLSKTYKSPNAPVSIRYPEAFVLTKAPDKDCEVSMRSHEGGAGQAADLRFACGDLPGGMSLESYEQVFESELQKTQRVVKEYPQTNQAWGLHKSIHGIRKMYQLNLNGSILLQQQFFFTSADKVCVLSLSTVAWDIKDAAELFSQVLNAVEAH